MKGMRGEISFPRKTWLLAFAGTGLSEVSEKREKGRRKGDSLLAVKRKWGRQGQLREIREKRKPRRTAGRGGPQRLDEAKRSEKRKENRQEVLMGPVQNSIAKGGGGGGKCGETKSQHRGGGPALKR